MICNQYHLNHSDNNLWAGMFRTSLINLLYYPYLLSMSFVMNVTDIYHPHVVILTLGELEHLYFSSLVILISLYSNSFYHQHQSTLMWLLPVTFALWFASVPLRVFRPNLGTRFFLGGKAVTVCVLVMLGKYFVSVKYMFVCVKLVCVCVKLLKI
jgi:hypothetical protein